MSDLNKDCPSIFFDLDRNAPALELFSEHSHIGMIVVRLAPQKQVFLNDYLCDMLGYPRDELLAFGENFYSLFLPEWTDSVKSALIRAKDNAVPEKLECRARCKDGSLIWVSLIFFSFFDDDGGSYYSCIVSNTSESREYFEEIRYRIDHDSLTGLYGREKFFNVTQKIIADNPDKTFAIVRFDISRFKVYNDLYGLESGDRFLINIAASIKRIALEISPLSTYARIEGDHFVLCLPRGELDYDNLISKITEEINSYSGAFTAVPCFGIYEVDDPGLSVAIMTDRARLAQNSVKGSYNVQYKIYENILRSSMINQQEIINHMQLSLDSGEFVIYVQPQYSAATEKICGGEVLVRWNYPGDGILPPNEFIPVFEENGFITKLDRYIWEEACKLLRRIKDNGCKLLPISVNVSRVDLLLSDVTDFLCSLTEKYDIPRNMLYLEITESAYAFDTEPLFAVISELQKCGFVVEMDDFGSGYSSLNILKDAPLDIIKLDMAFQKTGSRYDRGGIVLASIIEMAHKIGLPAIAEGVELEEQASYLKSIGCDIMQGYLYSRPMESEAFFELINVLNGNYGSATELMENVSRLSAIRLSPEENAVAEANIEATQSAPPRRPLTPTGTNAAAKQLDRRYKKLLDSMSTIIFDYNNETDCFSYSLSQPGSHINEKTIRGFKQNNKAKQFIHANMINLFFDAINICAESEANRTIEFLSMFFYDKFSWTRAFIVPIYDKNNKPCGVIGKMDNIHEEKLKLLNQQQRLKEKAKTDGMTGLLNKEAICESISRLLRSQKNLPSLLIELDVDNFKSVNDTYGHRRGDKLIKKLASTLKLSCRSSDLVGRIGGDEFLIFMRHIHTRQLAERKLGSVLEDINDCLLEFGCGELSPSVSMGAAIIEKPCEYSKAFDTVDKALYSVKDSTKGRYKLA